MKPFCVHKAQQISIRMYGDWLIPNLINGIRHSILFIKKSYVIPRERSNMGFYLFCWERFSSISCFWDNLCIVTLIFQLYNVFDTYALVILSLQRIPNHYMFYPNGLIFYLLLLILNCWGRFLLSVSFWKRDIIK